MPVKSNIASIEIPIHKMSEYIALIAEDEFEKFARFLITNYLEPKSPKNDDPKAYINHHKFVVNVTKTDVKLIVFNDSDDAEFVEYGRGPGKNPPIQPILAWVRRKGLNVAYNRASRARTNRKIRASRRAPTYRSLDEIQYSIAKRISFDIGLYGTKGKYIYEKLIEDNQKAINKVVRNIEKNAALLLQY